MLSDKCLRVTAFVALLLSVVCLSGCIRIQIVDRTPSTLAPTPPMEKEKVEAHDLAVLAVDFDLPLEYEKIMERKNKGEGITLLVAVENTGASTEQNVVVRVQLSKDEGRTVFLQKDEAVQSIAPGEIKLVHFRDTEVPFSYEYRLRVSVLPVLGETQLVDNQKSYDLLITQP